jgi:hypothetical protein
VLIEAKAEERIKLRIDLKDDIAAMPAVPAIRATTRDILLAPECSETIAAIASFDRNMCLIDKIRHATSGRTQG